MSCDRVTDGSGRKQTAAKRRTRHFQTGTAAFGSQERGFVLISVVVTITLVAAIAFMLSYQGASESTLASGELEHDQLHYIAEAGLAHAEMQLAANTSCGGYTDIAKTDFAGESYSVRFVSTKDSPVTVESTALPGAGAGLTLRSENLRAYEPPTEITLQFSDTNGRDTILDDFYPIRNYGGAGYLKIESGGWIQRPMLHIDVSEIPAGATIQSARLELKQNNVNAPGQVFVHRMTREWTEGTRNGGGIADGATWETHDGTNAWTTPGGDFDSTVYGTGYVTSSVTQPSFDVTALVQDWVSGAVPNYGMILVGDNNVKNAGLVSRETNNPAEAPKLIVTYACECGSACGGKSEPQGNVLLAVSDSANPTLQDQARQALIESFGFVVTIIDDGAAQAEFDNAVAVSDVAYISEEIASGTLGTKLQDAPIGVVIEEEKIHLEFGISSAETTFSEDTIDIVDNTHYITSPFGLGQISFVSSLQPVGAPTGSLAPGLNVLAQRPSSTTGMLDVIEKGGELYGGGVAAGRRVKLPWGGNEFDINSLTSDGQTIMRRAIEWGAGNESGAASYKVLFVMGSVAGAGPTAEELEHQALLESWGHTVELIDDDATQTEFDTAVAANDVVFTTNDITASRLGTKVVDATIGFVTSEANLSDEFGLSSAIAWDSGSQVEINDNTHYVTSPFATGLLAILTTSESLAYVTGTLSPDLGQLGSSASGFGIVSLEAGDAMHSGGTAAGRRIQLPWGGNGFSPLNLTTDGLTILQRAIEWGAGAGDAPMAGPLAHWKLDDGVGTTAIDSEGGHDGTLVNGPTWAVGQSGDALNFDGTDDYVDLTSDAELDDLFDGGATVSAWIYPTGWGENGYGRVLDKSSSASSTGDGWVIRMNVDSGGTLNFGQGFSSGRGWWKPPNGSISLNAWQHVAVTYDASSTANEPVIYIDGSAVAVTRVDSPSGSIRSDAAINLRLANHAGGTAHTFEGRIDDVRIYDRELTATEVSDLVAESGGGGGGGGPPACAATFADDFETDDYTGSTGTAAWASDWAEINDSGNPNNGDIQVVAASGNQVLQVGDSIEGAQRVADLSSYASATLALGYWRSGLDSADEFSSVEVSADGISWALLDQIVGPGSDSTSSPPTVVSYDISAHLSAATHVRFLTAASNSKFDRILIDDVEICVNN